MPYGLDSYGLGKQSRSFVYPLQSELLPLINEKLNPFVEQVTIRQLDLMSPVGDGSLRSSTGRLAAPELGFPPVAETEEPVESDPAESGQPTESDPVESGQPTDPDPAVSGPIPTDPVPTDPGTEDPAQSDPVETMPAWLRPPQDSQPPASDPPAPSGAPAGAES